MAINWSEVAQSAFQGAASSAGSNLASGFGSHIELKLNKWLNPEAYKNAMRRHLTGAEKEQNAFNAEQAGIQRDFAEHMFEREAALSNTAFQRQTADMQAAGINPALMYGGAGSSGAAVPTASSGSAASGSASAPMNLSDLLQLGLLSAQRSKIEAETSKIKSETRGQDIDNANKPEYWNRQLALMGANKAEAEANIENLLQQVKTGAADEALKRSNERLTDVKVTQADLENAILAYKVGMTATDAKYYEAMKSLDLALKSATLDKTEEEIKNLRKARALMQAQIITEGAKTKMFNEQATATYEFGRYTHKKTTWIDADEIEKLTNLGANTRLVHYLARKYDAEADYTEMKPLLELVQTLGDFVGDVVD